jgi:serine/threonine-protein kinase
VPSSAHKPDGPASEVFPKSSRPTDETLAQDTLDVAPTAEHELQSARPGSSHSGTLKSAGPAGTGSGASLVAASREQTLGPTPTETLRYEEIFRTRAFLRIALGLAVVVGASASFMPGDPFARRVLLFGMAAIALPCAWFAWLLRDEAAYTPKRMLVTAYGCVAGALSGIYFFGPFSPAPTVLPFGLYFFSLSQSFRETLFVYLSCAVGQAFMAFGVTMGFLVDRSLIRATGLAPLERGIVTALVEAVLFATFLIGRASREATLKAIEQHDKVVRNLAQREALLAEARRELDRALRAGGVGRYTDHTLGSFRVGKIIGRGAMGEVYEAVHVTSGQQAALKLLQSEMLRSPDSIRRFTREAQIAAALKVENVVAVYEIGDIATGVPYIAMERLEGQDLAEYLREHGRLTMKDTIRLVRDVARGLEAARDAGIVHRDLKPANLFYAKRAEGVYVWKILDFGVSKLLGTLQGTLTKDALVGTPEYMAPEQPLGREVSHRTDIHALGVICYRALTGRPAFTGEGLMETVYNVVNRLPPRPTEALSTLPEGVDVVLAIAMAKSPENRFEHAHELARALEAAHENKVSGELRARAHALLERDPWGTPV